MTDTQAPTQNTARTHQKVRSQRLLSSGTDSAQPQDIARTQGKPAKSKPPTRAPPKKGAAEIVDLVSSSDDDSRLPHAEKTCQAIPSSTQLESQTRQPSTVDNNEKHGRQGPSIHTVLPSSSSSNGPPSFALNRATQQSGTAASQTSTFTSYRSVIPAQSQLLTPPRSQLSARKRKIEHKISDNSDSGSNFEPSSEDDEPLISRSQKPSTKKFHTFSQISSPSSSVKQPRKNLNNALPFKA